MLMKTFGIVVGVLLAALAFIAIVGSMAPATPRSEARDLCANAKTIAYTAREKAATEDICAELMREADRKMGRVQ